MREIKFRLVKDKKIVGYEFHELGNFGNISIAYRMSFIKTDVELSGHIVHDHKDQFTGKFDESKVEIYEGDYLRDEESLHKIEWDEEGCAFECLLHIENDEWEWDGDIELSINIEKLHIIGNIHENKIIADPEKEDHWKMVKNENPKSPEIK